VSRDHFFKIKDPSYFSYQIWHVGGASQVPASERQIKGATAG